MKTSTPSLGVDLLSTKCLDSTTRMAGTCIAPTRRRTNIFSLYVPEHGTVNRSKPPLTYLKQIAWLLTNNPEHLTAEKIAKLANDRKEWSRRTAANKGKLNSIEFTKIGSKLTPNIFAFSNRSNSVMIYLK